MKKYPDLVENEWVDPVMKGFKFACCDCSLVHEIDFKTEPYGRGRRVLFRMRRNDRATAAMRRKR